MKKVIALLLCIWLICCFAGCGGETPREEDGGIKTFSVGFAKVSITPGTGIALGGYGDSATRLSEGNLEPIYATCIAFADGFGEKMVLITHDLSQCPISVFGALRDRISEKTGLPGDRILFAGSHSHSSPTLSEPFTETVRYIQTFQEKCVDGAVAALEDLSPASLRTGFARVDRANTVRHYLLADGSYQGRNMGAVPKADIIGHYGRPDNLLQVAEFVREEKKNVVLINWQGHPMGPAPGAYNMCGPNYVGPLRTELEKLHDCHVAYMLSGSGNLNNSSQIEGDVEQKTYQDLGSRLARVAYEVLQNSMLDGKADRLQVKYNPFKLKDNSTYEVTAPMFAVSVGDWACVTAPFEIFDTNSVAVRENSKFRMTFFASCSNDSMGYLPTPPSFDWQITYEAQITNFPKGTDAVIRDEQLRMLDGLFTAGGYTEQEKPDGYLTPEFVPETDDVVYRNMTPGDLSQTQEVENGFFALKLLKDHKIKKMLAIDQITAERVLAQEQMKLIFNEQNVIVDVIPQ